MSKHTTRPQPSHSRRHFFPRWPQSLYTRLALWNLLAFTFALIVLGSAVYTLVYYSLLSSLDKRLSIHGEKLQTATRIRLHTGHLVNQVLFENLVLDIQGDEFTSDQPYIKLLDITTGNTVQLSPNLKQEKLLPHRSDILDEFTAAAQGEYVPPKTYQGNQGQQVRVLTMALYNADRQVIAVAQIGRSLESVNQVLFTLSIVLGLGSLCAIVLAYLIGFFLTNHELRPLRMLSLTMRRLNAQKLGAHFPVKKAPTEIAALAEAFNQMSERLQASFTLQRNFVADVSHELRTPLTAIRGQIDVLLMHPELKSDISQDVQQIRAELVRLSRLVTNLLGSARAEVGIVPHIPPENTQLIELDTLLIEIARQTRFANQEVEIILGDLQQCQVPGDADLLKQLLFNIIDNALNHTSPGGTVHLNVIGTDEIPCELLQQRPLQTSWTRISICDTGSGIAPSDLPHIFTRYYRATTGNSRSKLGAGLGLSLAHLIAEAHGGTITVESELNKGTCFFIWLPSTQTTSFTHHPNKAEDLADM